ncbi:MAG: 3-phosphoshikimate 1-carboxyvinyltransferase [Spirochaetota bacterium]
MKVQLTRTSLGGEINVPASKSHTIRAFLIASLAEGTSTILNPLESADTRACIETCKAFGAEISRNSGGYTVLGTGGVIKTPPDVINVGNSGTTLYLAAGIAALGSRWTIFTGDEQIRSRPIQPLLTSLSDLGAAACSARENGCAPVMIKGPLSGGKTSIECHTSQYLSSLLICTPLAQDDTEMDVPLLNEQPYVEMTLRWLDEQGLTYKREGLRRFFIPGRQAYRPFSKQVPSDFSSAAFFLCAAAITRSKLFLKGLDMEDSQGDKAVVYMLQAMGCQAEIKPEGILIDGRTFALKNGRLTGRDFDLNATPDALPAMAATACYAEGTTRLLNVPQARLKETDRISVMHQELEKMGAHIEEQPDGLIIHGAAPGTERDGNYTGGSLRGCPVHGHSDHRVVMALSIAALGAHGITTIDTAEAVDVTFPGFFKLLEALKPPSR